MLAFRSRCQQVMSALLTSEEESSWSQEELLPTLSAAGYGTGNNGTRDGETEFNLKGKPSLETMAKRGLLPTLTIDGKNGGRDLPGTLGGHLNPEWCLWFMGFPAVWLDVDDGPAFARSATPSSRRAPKSSATSSESSSSETLQPKKTSP